VAQALTDSRLGRRRVGDMNKHTPSSDRSPEGVIDVLMVETEGSPSLP